MVNKAKAKLTRREMLKAVSLLSGPALAGLYAPHPPPPFRSSLRDTFQEKKFVGLIEFVGEGHIPMELPMGSGLDGRLYTDLSSVVPDRPITPNEKFYVRTRASEFLDDRNPWVIKVSGALKQSVKIGIADLRKMSKPAGSHLMECSGNVRFAHFGMLSVADWTGTPMSEILESVRIEKPMSRVLISGFDRYPIPSSTSSPGASWIFTVDELNSCKAFLATAMNGVSLSRDHGAPVRLVIPGWYGCSCIKWVNEIALVDDDVPVTSQMQEFATRTMQQGVPELARDYRAPVIDQAAMPLRVEKWLLGQKIDYRVSGIAWGGFRRVSGLEIRFNPEEDFVPVDDFKQIANDPWSFWTHAWTPRKPGIYSIQLRVKDSSVPSRRLDAGYYVRSVEVAEI